MKYRVSAWRLGIGKAPFVEAFDAEDDQEARKKFKEIRKDSKYEFDDLTLWRIEQERAIDLL